MKIKGWWVTKSDMEGWSLLVIIEEECGKDDKAKDN